MEHTVAANGDLATLDWTLAVAEQLLFYLLRRMDCQHEIGVGLCSVDGFWRHGPAAQFASWGVDESRLAATLLRIYLQLFACLRVISCQLCGQAMAIHRLWRRSACLCCSLHWPVSVASNGELITVTAA